MVVVSVYVDVYLEPHRMLNPPAWAAAIREAGFPLEMDTDWDPEDFNGFLPCRYRGVDSGFEFYRDLLEESELRERGVPLGRRLRISHVTHSLFREAACAGIAAAVLCSATDGVLSEEGETPLSADGVVARFRELLPTFDLDMERQEAEQARKAERPWWKFWA